MSPARLRHPLEEGIPPDWASSWGDDRYGVWAGFELGEVEQRMRWIPPGRFLMGSPEDEPGRWEAEGPQHEVTLPQGFWLGETAVTQALWEVVMGENPSRFRTPDRPVEQVTWDDCEKFLERTESLQPGLRLRLPSEAEWEYACRAGTTTATYAGPLEIRGAHDAPILDGIAWYGGNSGERFELEEGADSSGWPEKQYDHRKAGSHPVGTKAPNPWGLFDMLGNVWEWCEDHWQDHYEAGPVVDPQGPREGTDRVDRGGSWYGSARVVRAACRSGWRPDDRHDSLGVRLARGQD